jgi:hypothetical protein
MISPDRDHHKVGATRLPAPGVHPSASSSTSEQMSRAERRLRPAYAPGATAMLRTPGSATAAIHTCRGLVRGGAIAFSTAQHQVTAQSFYREEGMMATPKRAPRGQRRGQPAKTQSLDDVVQDTVRRWRTHHLDYDQTKYVVERVRSSTESLGEPYMECATAYGGESSAARQAAPAQLCRIASHAASWASSAGSAVSAWLRSSCGSAPRS